MEAELPLQVELLTARQLHLLLKLEVLQDVLHLGKVPRMPLRGAMFNISVQFNLHCVSCTSSATHKEERKTPVGILFIGEPATGTPTAHW